MKSDKYYISCISIIKSPKNLVKPSNLVFLKTYNTEFNEIIITFADQNGGPFETEDKVNLALLINK